MYCDLIELPCGVTRPRYHPRPERLQLHRPRGKECDTCTRTERQGVYCWGQTTYSVPPDEVEAKSRRKEPVRSGRDLFGEEW